MSLLFLTIIILLSFSRMVVCQLEHKLFLQVTILTFLLSSLHQDPVIGYVIQKDCDEEQQEERLVREQES